LINDLEEKNDELHGLLVKFEHKMAHCNLDIYNDGDWKKI